MDDSQIIDLYFARSETAIQETDSKYGGYCYKIAYGILANREDAEESVSDTYLSAWHSAPQACKALYIFRQADPEHKQSNCPTT